MNDSTTSTGPGAGGAARPDGPGQGDTRTDLLRAARGLFGRRGYDGASVRAITREAGANLGAVTYHFGSKEELYAAVLDQALGPLADRIAEAVAATGPAMGRIDRVARAYVRHLAANPDLPHLLMQEIAAGKPPPPPVMRMLSRVAGMITGLVRQGQEEGTVRAGDPLLLTLSLVSQPVYFALVRRAVGHLRGIDPMAPDSLDALEDHVAAVATAGLSAPPEAS